MPHPQGVIELILLRKASPPQQAPSPFQISRHHFPSACFRPGTSIYVILVNLPLLPKSLHSEGTVSPFSHGGTKALTGAVTCPGSSTDTRVCWVPCPCLLLSHQPPPPTAATVPRKDFGSQQAEAVLGVRGSSSQSTQLLFQVGKVPPRCPLPRLPSSKGHEGWESEARPLRLRECPPSAWERLLSVLGVGVDRESRH